MCSFESVNGLWAHNLSPERRGVHSSLCSSFVFVFRGLLFILPTLQTLQVFCGLCWLWASLFGTQWLAHNTSLWDTLWWSHPSCLPVKPKPCFQNWNERVCMWAFSCLSLSACLQCFLTALLTVYHDPYLMNFCFDSKACMQSVSYMNPKQSRRIF